jgi:hypothetical protein
MSLLTPERPITVKPFSVVPALAGLPEIEQEPGSLAAHNTSSRRVAGNGVDLAEGCIVTKSIKYTHRLTHWVSAVRLDPTKAREIVSKKLIDHDHY